MTLIAWLSILLATFGVALALVHLVSVLKFFAVLTAPPEVNPPGQRWPNVAILLSLRGADPSLARGLLQLLSQDYPNYSVRIVVDSAKDPAAGVVRDIIHETNHRRVTIEALRHRRTTCSLKCSALVQLANGLSEHDEVIVLADADLVSHPRWLQELIAPLMQPDVGAVFGNRWFWPQQASWGSLVRYTWNLGAVMPMYFLNIPWGGTFAIRTSDLRKTGLINQWSKAAVEDAPVWDSLRASKLALKFVPSLMMVNREDCTLPFAFDFIKRQLTWTRLYHRHWPVVVGHTLLAMAVMVAGFSLPVVAALSGDTPSFLVALVGFSVYALSAFFTIALLETAIRKIVRRRGTGESLPPFSVTRMAKFLMALPIAQTVQFAATLTAIVRRRVAWRGVTYRIQGPWDIHLIDYEQFEQPVDASGNLSL